MRKKLLHFYSLFFIVNILIIFLFILISKISYDRLNMVALVPMVMLLINMLYAFNNIGRRTVFLVFQVGFFTFLLGEVFFSIMIENSINLYNLSRQTYVHTFMSMTISLLCIFIGYYFSEKRVKIDSYNYNNYNNDIYIKKIKSVSRVIYCMAFVAQVAILIEKAIFVGNIGYTEYYLSFTSRLPFFITGLSAFYYISFYSFLATFPSKNQAYPLILMYIFVAVLSLGFGQRNGFVLDIFVLIIYLSYRNNLKNKRKNEVWLSKNQVIIGICILPFVITLLYNIGHTRFGQYTSHNTIGKSIEQFFISQGESIQTINYGYEYKDRMPQQNTFYILGPIKDYLTQNIISSSILGFENWQHDPIAKATRASLYGSSLAYLLFPEGYLIGKGMDSCYIAELYQDFGYIGIIIGSFILGFIINLCDNVHTKKWWKYAIILIITRGIIYLPRTSTLGWIIKTINLPNILFLLIVTFMTYKAKSYVKFKSNYSISLIE